VCKCQSKQVQRGAVRSIADANRRTRNASLNSLQNSLITLQQPGHLPNSARSLQAGAAQPQTRSPGAPCRLLPARRPGGPARSAPRP